VALAVALASPIATAARRPCSTRRRELHQPGAAGAEQQRARPAQHPVDAGGEQQRAAAAGRQRGGERAPAERPRDAVAGDAGADQPDGEGRRVKGDLDAAEPELAAQLGQDHAEAVEQVAEAAERGVHGQGGAAAPQRGGVRAAVGVPHLAPPPLLILAKRA
jgi:hypothetical protein